MLEGSDNVALKRRLARARAHGRGIFGIGFWKNSKVDMENIAGRLRKRNSVSNVFVLIFETLLLLKLNLVCCQP